MYLHTILIIQVNFKNTFNQIKYANFLFIFQIKWNQIRLSQDTFFFFPKYLRFTVQHEYVIFTPFTQTRLPLEKKRRISNAMPIHQALSLVIAQN